MFLAERYERDPNSKVRYTECYIDYLGFLAAKKMRKVSKKEFSAALEDESFETQKTSIRDPLTNETTSFNVVWGLKRLPIQRNIPDTPDIPLLSLSSQFSKKSIENTGQLGGLEYREYQEYSWREWINNQPGGIVEIDTLLSEFPGLDLSALRVNGEIYEPRPGFVRCIL
jgi:hypothetical protein